MQYLHTCQRMLLLNLTDNEDDHNVNVCHVQACLYGTWLGGRTP